MVVVSKYSLSHKCVSLEPACLMILLDLFLWQLFPLDAGLQWLPHPLHPILNDTTAECHSWWTTISSAILESTANVP